ncbi:hypothetical protein [Actinoplanes sp. NPDC051494]|uniref:hypothetical protein n=1 Tax=Actinoplanes sp. NPDC051494 TaxID=3363907 RepID=UPI00379D9278
MDKKRRRFTVSAEVTVEVTDEAAVRKAALGKVTATTFGADGDRSPEDVRSDELAAAQDDLLTAVNWIIDPDAVVERGVGAEVTGSTVTVSEGDSSGLNDHSSDASTLPDFATLFPVCRCGTDNCDACTGFQMTPRSAVMLWSMAQLHSDHAYTDVEQFGDTPVSEKDTMWMAFADYPPITWSQDAVWRRQAARAFDDLAGDLAGGHLPLATCPAEEMSMHLMLSSAQAAAADGWGIPPEELALLPEHDDDYDWDLAVDVLLQDEDILHLFNKQLDGIEDPESEENQRFRIGDYRPEAWFKPFQNATPRDGRRPFRR